MIPVEQVRHGHVVELPNGRQMPVVRVERYDADFVVVYQDGPLEKILRVMRAGDLVNVIDSGDARELDPLPDHEAERQFLVSLYRRFGGLTDSELVERSNELLADAGLPLKPASLIMRRRRELERRDQIETVGERRHPESGSVEPVWQLVIQPEQTTIADALYPEPDL